LHHPNETGWANVGYFRDVEGRVKVPMDILEKVYRKSDSIVFRKIGDEFILVPIRQNVGDLDSIFTLNETAARIWELIDGERSLHEIKNTMTEEFDVTPAEAEKDLIEHLQQLEGIKAVSNR
jgi:ppGpp synthetase/RelA/SpoT-type nucleotidyltranferase